MEQSFWWLVLYGTFAGCVVFGLFCVWIAWLENRAAKRF